MSVQLSNGDDMDNLETSMFFNDGLAALDLPAERQDAMGDLMDPLEMNLEDFASEWVWKDAGLTKTPWFFKKEKADWGKGRNVIKGDFVNDIESAMADVEVQLIDITTPQFVARMSKLASQALTGDKELEIWFVSENGNKVMRRVEVLDMTDITCAMWVCDASINKLMTNRTSKAAHEAHHLIKTFSNKAKWPKVKKAIQLSAVIAKNNGDVTQIDVDNCINQVKEILDIKFNLSRTMFTFVVQYFWDCVRGFNMGGEIKAKWVKYYTYKSLLKNTQDDSLNFDNNWGGE